MLFLNMKCYSLIWKSNFNCSAIQWNTWRKNICEGRILCKAIRDVLVVKLVGSVIAPCLTLVRKYHYDIASFIEHSLNNLSFVSQMTGIAIILKILNRNITLLTNVATKVTLIIMLRMSLIWAVIIQYCL